MKTYQMSYNDDESQELKKEYYVNNDFNSTIVHMIYVRMAQSLNKTTEYDQTQIMIIYHFQFKEIQY